MRAVQMDNAGKWSASQATGPFLQMDLRPFKRETSQAPVGKGSCEYNVRRSGKRRIVLVIFAHQEVESFKKQKWEATYFDENRNRNSVLRAFDMCPKDGPHTHTRTYVEMRMMIESTWIESYTHFFAHPMEVFVFLFGIQKFAW